MCVEIIKNIKEEEIEVVYRAKCPYCRKEFEFDNHEYSTLECGHCLKEIEVV